MHIFISDIHISPTGALYQNLLNFLENLPQQCSRLYILGDLFASWLGDDIEQSKYPKLCTTLQKLSARMDIFFQHGNRDFLVGHQFLKSCKMQLLPQIHVIQYPFGKCLVSHGDLLCTNDKTYQRLRKILRNTLVQKIYFYLPKWFRHKIANLIKNTSKRHNLSKVKKYSKILDASSSAIEQLQAQYNFKLLIHGHTHLPSALNLISSKTHESFTKIVLGDWHHTFANILILPQEMIQNPALDSLQQSINLTNVDFNPS